MILDRTVTLIKAHTHGGVPHAIGTELRVLEHDAAWLIERGIAMASGGYIAADAAYALADPLPPPDAADPAPINDTADDEHPLALDTTDTDPMNTGDDHE